MSTIEAELVARYGPEVLRTRAREAIPPRYAAQGHLLVTTAKPAQRRKLVDEIRSQRIRAYAPPEAGRYTFSNALPAFSKHAANVVGEVSRKAIATLYPPRPKRRRDDENPFKVGQSAWKGEIPVTVAHVSGRLCRVEWDMLGKTQTQSIHYTQLRPG